MNLFVLWLELILEVAAGSNTIKLVMNVISSTSVSVAVTVLGLSVKYESQMRSN